MNGLIDGVVNVTFGAIKGVKVLSKPEVIISQLKDIFPDLVLIVLMVLIILRYIGFEGASKYIALTLVIAVLVALF